MGMAVKECFTEEGTAEPRGENHEIEGHDILRPTGSKREVAKPKRCPLNAPGECQERNVNRNPKGRRTSALWTLVPCAQVTVTLLFRPMCPFWLKIPLDSLSCGLSQLYAIHFAAIMAFIWTVAKRRKPYHGALPLLSNCTTLFEVSNK